MPCYFRLISLQGYRSPPHGVRQKVSEHSDVEFQNKSPPNMRHITYDFGFDLKENALLFQAHFTSGL